MIDRDELVARLREGTFGSDVHKTDVYLNAICSAAAAQIERDGLEIERLRLALRIIAGYEQCLDNLMSNADIARAALNKDSNQ